ncbi:cellobiohydrolase [Microbacterium sp. Root61]|uniref:glycoside hydrolase family 6 protein n=1 Tax=Microbacterium sp. Root61 TaxID=1736570 RepID=UPI0006FE0B8D|nr:glycoside hydrolase family 6 protein [Microbacterium sp. Root61]KRA25679.1 cellobiohydrolase [Microbacterium sp. Root61]
MTSADPARTPAPRSSELRSGRTRLVALIVGAAGVAVIAVVVALLLWPAGFGAPTPPGDGTQVVASALSKAHAAAATGTAGTPEHDAAVYLSAQPTAVWLTPEADPIAQVPARVAALADEARTQSATLALVIYGLPGRDCGGHSAGGLEPAAYAEWTTAIGDVLRENADVSSILILEPDSLALAPECGNADERSAQLRSAVEALAAPHTWIYLDGGHSAWLPAEQMAQLIEDVGVLDQVRGFATNVSNYNATDAEVAYAHALAALLPGARAVIDTSRNGVGSNGEWCNPSGRRVGSPGGEVHDDVVDSNLWIKPPGESDGTCNGGPTAGTWWPRAAVTLTSDAPVD